LRTILNLSQRRPLALHGEERKRRCERIKSASDRDACMRGGGAHLGDNKLNILLLIDGQFVDGLDLPLGAAGADWRGVRSLRIKGRSWR
jgi:hypothetical protein